MRLSICVLLLAEVYSLAYGIELHGDNICPVEEEGNCGAFRKEELTLQKHVQTVVLHTTESCLDITQLFRCKVKNNGTKISYKGVPNKVKTIVLKCCLGYYQTAEGTCEICPKGYYGTNCTLRCINCTSEEICDNAVGCCDPNSNQCGLARSEFLKEPTSDRGWLIGVLAVAVSAVVLLLFGTIFYRKKYMKEKDPDLPTLTYHPHVKEFLPPSEIEAREFNNPLYRQSTAELPSKLSVEEEIAARNKLSAQPVDLSTNEYATLDEVSSSLAGPSSREPLLRDQSLLHAVNHSAQLCSH
ncbi:unnamed protein product [Toxocara canis]|uniref:EMI domain-containing protein n=1 Tax=Toxocara canis TaxID=6265 RepID=A0A183UH83_TOXCA|nr:unnamed protein product [Toxocara canis]